MINKYLTFLSLVLFLFHTPLQASTESENSIVLDDIDNKFVNKTVTDIKINGLSRTRKSVVLRELLIQAGDRLTRTALAESLQRLRNLRIFSKVNAEIEAVDDFNVNIVLRLEERWTLIPIAKFTDAGDTLYYVLGVYNVNSFGRYIETGAQFESWNNEAGGVAWFRNPRFMNHRLLFGGDIWSVKRPRILYKPDGSDEGSYVALRKRANFFLDKEFNDTLTFGVGIELIEDQIIDTQEDQLITPAIKSHLDNFAKPRNRIVSLHANIGKINHHGEILKGKSLNLNAGWSRRAFASDENYSRLDLDANSFWAPNHRTNIALRARLGWTDSQTLPNYYLLGGFENARGYYDGQIRTQAFWQSNLEYRSTFHKHHWYFMQAIAFADAMQAIKPDADLEQNNSDVFSSAGIGLRIGSPKIYRFTMRLDLAVFTSHPATSRLSLGVQQFF